MAEEIENKGLDNPQQPDNNTTAPTEVKTSTDVETWGATTSTDTDTPPAPATTSQDAPGTAGSDRKIKTLQDFLDQMEQPETAEERKKRERREKSAKIVSAISDGIQAMSNLFFTTRYAPNAYNHGKSSQLDAQSAAIEKARKEREADADRYLKFALALGDAENERAKTVREAEVEQERRKLAREKAQREAERHEWSAVLQPDKKREQAGKADKAEQEARTARIEAEHADERVMSEINRNNRANRSGSGGNRGGNYQIRRRRSDGTYEYRGGFRSAAEARNYVGTHSDERWEFAITPVRTERTDAYNDKTVTVRDESTVPQYEPWSLDD